MQTTVSVAALTASTGHGEASHLGPQAADLVGHGSHHCSTPSPSVHATVRERTSCTATSER